MKALLALVTVLAAAADRAGGAVVFARYYAHPAVEDRNGVIAPWYRAQNGVCDFRARVAAETLKRYPWVVEPRAVAAAPEYVFSGAWKITAEGAISVPAIGNWANGDLGQRASYVLSALVDYYQYTGDAAAIAIIDRQADVILDHCLTPPDHPWPSFPITVPVQGKPYGKADPAGFIQLDITGELGLALVRAAHLAGEARWLDAATHWGEVLARKRHRDGGPPWGRYANPEDVPWEDHMTGGIVFILDFFDALIRAGRTGEGDCIAEARAAAAAYLRDVLLPAWTAHETWGRNYWDWPCPVQVENVTEFAARYLMTHPREFPNWKADTRNILTLFLNRTGVSPGSGGDVYSGAWAYPESSGCCGRSLWYGPLELAPVYAEYGVRAGSAWALEMARRQMILATYDCHETGVVQDNIDGGPIVAGDWFKIAHPMALKHVLAAIAWQPEIFGASRENHIVRSSSVVAHVTYGDGAIEYRTVDAPAEAIDVLRLAFQPAAARAGGTDLPLRTELAENGYTARKLPDGDWIVEIRHDGATEAGVRGDDPQSAIDASGRAGETIERAFTGNQVRVTGAYDPAGGRADVFLDGTRQLAGIDCWNPSRRENQLLFYRNGLPEGQHTIKIVPRDDANPLSAGRKVDIATIFFSSATPEGPLAFGEGGGPIDAQRFIFGYTGRQDYVDALGAAWRPGTEFIIRAGDLVDSVAAAWWTRPTRFEIDGTPDPEIYRYGIHGRDVWVNVTVGPGKYHVTLKFAESRAIEPTRRAQSIQINGRTVVEALDIAATATQAGPGAPVRRPGDPYALWPGIGRAVDLVFDGIEPKNGVISVRLTGHDGCEAILQAMEVGPGRGGVGAQPISLPPAAAQAARGPDGNLLANGDFEAGLAGEVGALGKRGGNNGWTFVFAGASTSYVFPESAYSIHPEWGLPVFHGGKEALRTHTARRGHTIVYQEVAVEPEKGYTASVWVKADDLHGTGFGKDPGDAAALWIQELDQEGAVAADHPRQEVRTAGGFHQLSLTFTTAKKTTRVRFILDTTIACPYDQGHVTYDDCRLAASEKAP